MCVARSSPHDGVDFGPASIGDPVIASADGIVVGVASDPRWGTEVDILHRGYALDRQSGGHAYMTGYVHLRRALVSTGDLVRRGQVIGEVGWFPWSDGIVHVHWRLWGPHGDLDPLTKSDGCYDAGKRYSDTVLQLTYPLRC